MGGVQCADAEPLWTGRGRPYDESTLRKDARELAQHGGTEILARAVERSVEQAVERSGAKAVVYMDMFDQVHWTKEPAHGADWQPRQSPAGSHLLRDDICAAEDGPALAYHVSRHKPASPLHDGLEALYAAPGRAAHYGLRRRLGSTSGIVAAVADRPCSGRWMGPFPT